MCRIYGTGENQYVRLCYRYGIHRGKRVPRNEWPESGPGAVEGACYSRSPSQMFGIGRMRRGERVPDREHRCTNCSMVMSHYRYGLCELCASGKQPPMKAH